VRCVPCRRAEVAGLISALGAAQAKGWIDPEDDATAFVIVHWTCVPGARRCSITPPFGALTAIDFSAGVGRLRYQTALDSDIPPYECHEARHDLR